MPLRPAGTALANDLDNASVSQIEREWAESHGRSYLGPAGTGYDFYWPQNQAESDKHMKARDR
jgi:hypothetical protein